ncbi:hypothetical protein F5144DRAFT_591292 [Chaetomium tenue]|uniref:Uncharacterized protein n=1 Tax=Chaetomium tenue TaxID=1854479 RepID=A0ACB7PF49_9PEZI|nr:hypothetical protein F5144DRAFT_591292 [Chaetomium globosum]
MSPRTSTRLAAKALQTAKATPAPAIPAARAARAVPAVPAAPASPASPTTPPIRLFEHVAAWETWLEANHTDPTGLWLKISKKGSAIASVTYDEALDTALCFGWIDGQKKSHDVDHFLQRFTPRRKRSMWSQRNCAKVAVLVETGRMRPAGQAEIDAAKADGRWEKAYFSSSLMEVPDDFQAALGRNKKAKTFFEGLGKTKRYAFLWRIATVKREETRKKKIEQFVGLLSEGKTLPTISVFGHSRRIEKLEDSDVTILVVSPCRGSVVSRLRSRPMLARRLGKLHNAARLFLSRPACPVCGPEDLRRPRHFASILTFPPRQSPTMGTPQHTFVAETGQPPQRRRKARLACNPCRARKTGCDGRRPVCTACSLRGWDDKCGYPDSVMQPSAALQSRSLLAHVRRCNTRGGWAGLTHHAQKAAQPAGTRDAPTRVVRRLYLSRSVRSPIRVLPARSLVTNVTGSSPPYLLGPARQPEGVPSRMDMILYTVKLLKVVEEMRATARAPRIKLRPGSQDVTLPDPTALLGINTKVDDLFNELPEHLRVNADYSKFPLNPEEIKFFQTQSHALRFRLSLFRVFLLRPSLLAEAQRWATRDSGPVQTASLVFQERLHYEICNQCLNTVHEMLEEIHTSLATSGGISAWYALHCMNLFPCYLCVGHHSSRGYSFTTSRRPYRLRRARHRSAPTVSPVYRHAHRLNAGNPTNSSNHTRLRSRGITQTRSLLRSWGRG